MKKNCWEYYNCGREPGGDKVEDMGECPASTADKFDGINSGRNGGRYCWRVSGTNCAACGGKCMPNWADTNRDCLQCAFFNTIMNEERDKFKI